MTKAILVADDEPGFQALFRFLLEPKGFTVCSANDGLEAVELFEKQDFALILLDVHMPKMKGPEVLKRIREIKHSQPVVMLSSGADPDKVNKESTEMGAVACFQKPFDVKDILRVIEKTINEK
ncbi:MAG: response regulator [Elusimicrobia bacterium]|nr:response regulator [Candidatus Obscuribacterium magneticum]